MYCFFCGKENNDDRKFCKYCGKSLHPDAAEYQESPKIQKVSKSPGDSKGQTKMLIAIAILLFLILLALGALLFVYLRSGTVSPLDMHNDTDSKTEEGVTVDEAEISTAEADRNDSPEAEENKVYEYPVEEVKDDSVVVDNKNAEEKLRISYAEASSVLNATSKDHATYIANNVADGNYKTAWVEGVAGNGEGQILILHLDGAHKISKLKIFDGYLKTKRRYAINGRITKAVIDYGNGYQQVVDLQIMNPPEVETDFSPDEMGETDIIPETECVTDTISITIMNAVAGSKYEDTAVSEIEVYGE